MKAKTDTFNKPLSIFILSAFFSLFLLSSCDKVNETSTYKLRIPVEISLATFRAIPVEQRESLELSAPGQIYVYKDFLFINEVGRGIHIVDNSNPSSPKNRSFLPIEGNENLAVKNNILYADNYIDLLAFDISNPLDIKLIKRVENIFPNLSHNKPGVVTIYKDTTFTEKSWEVISYLPKQYEEFYAAHSPASSYGQGGSMARFTLLNDHLYVVERNSLRLFDVNTAADPKFVKAISLGFGIETIFPYDNKLFIGSNTGMSIYDATTPSAPEFLSTFAHVTSCDPVIVEGKLAYVTIRSGTMCNLGSNQLMVIDIENPKLPKLIKAHPMSNPHGLAIYGSNLFLCEGVYGLKVFNKNNLTASANPIFHLKDISTTDVIATDKSLIVRGYDGIYQYDHSNPSQLTELSRIQTHPGINHHNP